MRVCARVGGLAVTLPVPTDHPLHERFDEWRAAAERLRVAVVQAKARLGRPALGAVLMKDGIVVGDCFGLRAHQLRVFPVDARFPVGAFEAATRFVERMI